MFDSCEPQDVHDLIDAYPLAWVRAENGEASLLPLIGVFDAEGQLVELIGHFGLTNPLHAAFSANRSAQILFSGPQGYVSPSDAGRRDWGPTWNYAQVRVDADIAIEPDLTPHALDLLIGRCERGKAMPWAAGELGERYGQLVRHIVGFRARVRSVKPRFKLGQDEDLPTLRAILSNIGDEALAAWMVRFNRQRLEAAPND